MGYLDSLLQNPSKFMDYLYFLLLRSLLLLLFDCQTDPENSEGSNKDTAAHQNGWEGKS